MIHINLLPFRAARKKENVRQQVTIFLVFVLFITVALVWYNSKLNSEIKNLEDQILLTQKQLVIEKKKVREVEELKKKKAVYEQKLDIIRTLNMNREAAFHLLDTMTRMVVEKRMWFTDFEAIEKRKAVKKAPTRRRKKSKKTEKDEEAKPEPPPDVTVKITGIALDNKTVADFMTRLEDSAFFTEIRLIRLELEKFKQKGREDINLKRFEISCKRVPLKDIYLSKKEEP